MHYNTNNYTSIGNNCKLVTWMTEQVACMATVWPQWTATLLATGVWNQPRIKHRINNLSTVTSVLPWTIFLTVFMTTLWTAHTRHVSIQCCLV